jgi:hypothetical protein
MVGYMIAKRILYFEKFLSKIALTVKKNKA